VIKGDSLGPAVGLFGCHVHGIFVKVGDGMPPARDYFNNDASLELIASERGDTVAAHFDALL
jgi:hypothetical protein